jgi:WD40 repeat protein
VGSGRIVRTLDGNEVAATALAFSSDGGLLATGGEDGRVRLWRVNDGELLKTYSMHRYRGYPSSVDVMEFSPDGQRIVSYSSKEAARIWPVEKKIYATNLSDEEWAFLRARLPEPPRIVRMRTHALRDVFDAIFYVLRSGCPLRLLPGDFPPWPTVPTLPLPV